MSLASELQLVFESACAALSADEAQPAAEAYFLARSRTRFVQESWLSEAGDDPTVAVVTAALRQLETTFCLALDRLARPPSGHAACGQGSAAISCGDGGTQPDSCGPCGSTFADMDSSLLQAVLVGGGGGAPAGDAALQEVARRCMREVAGTLDDVVGLAAIKRELREAVLLPRLAPHLFTGIRRPQSNILFHGPPGTGKTLLVEKVAAEARMPLLAISPSSVLSKWSGESEKSLRVVFEAAALLQPAIIFIDEVDALAPARATGDDLSARRVLTELLLCLTALASRPSCLVFVMACTNRAEDLDPALTRRFERKVLVPLPDGEARAAFFRAALARPEVASELREVELQQLVAVTDGMSGSDLAAVCRDAAMAPLRELLAAVQAGRLAAQELAQAAPRKVEGADFEAAVQRTRWAACEQ